MSTTNLGQSAADTEQFLEGLRALLGKGNKLKRALFGTLADDIEKVYRRIEGLLRDIRVYQGISSVEADEQMLLTLRQKVATSTTEAEFKLAKKDLDALAKKLDATCEAAKSKAASVAWGPNRAAALRAIEAAVVAWASAEQEARFRASYTKLCEQADALGMDQAKAKGPEGTALAGRFDQLATSVAQARTNVTEDAKRWKDTRDNLGKLLAALGKLANPTTRADFEGGVDRLVADANERHLYAESATAGEKLATQLQQRIDALRPIKAAFVTQQPEARQQLANARPSLAEVVCVQFDEQLLALGRQAAEGNYQDAGPGLTALRDRLQTVVIDARQDKGRYTNHAARTSIPDDDRRLRAKHPQTAPTLLSGVLGELTTVQQVADTTRDYHRAVEQLDALATRIVTIEGKLQTSGPALEAYEERKAKYISEWMVASGELEAIEKNMAHLKPTQLRAGLEVLQFVPVPTGDRTVDDTRLGAIEERLATWRTEAGKYADPKSPAFQQLCRGEADRAEIAAQRRLYMDWRGRFTEAVTRLQSFGGDAATQALATFEQLEAKVARDDVAEVTAAVKELNRLFDTVTAAWDGGVAEAKRLQDLLRVRKQTFDTRFDELGKRLQKFRSKDSAFDYRQALEVQATQVMLAVTSYHRGVLDDAVAKMDQLIQNLAQTADEQGREPILKIEAAKKAIATGLDDVVLKKQMPAARTQLVTRKEKVFEDAGGTTPLDRGLAQIEQFRDEVAAKVAAAGAIAAHKLALVAAKKEFDASFAQLAAKMREYRKQEPYRELDVQGRNFGPLGESYNVWLALAKGEDERLYNEARAMMPELREKLAAALRDPYPLFAQEQNLLVAQEKKKADLDLDKQRFQLELQHYRNVDWKRAKEAIEQGGDKKRLELLVKMEKQAEKFLEKDDMDNARAKLGTMGLLARKLALDPQGGRSSPNLQSLGERWRRAVAGCNAAVAALVRRIGEECTKAGETPDAVATLRRELPQACAALSPSVFDAPVAVLLDSKSASAARQRAREQGLAHVHELLRNVQTNPLFKVLVANPFGVSFPAGALYAALNDLRYNLEISA